MIGTLVVSRLLVPATGTPVLNRILAEASGTLVVSKLPAPTSGTLERMETTTKTTLAAANLAETKQMPADGVPRSPEPSMELATSAARMAIGSVTVQKSLRSFAQTARKSKYFQHKIMFRAFVFPDTESC